MKAPQVPTTKKTEIRQFKGESFEVALHSALPPEMSRGHTEPLQPGSSVVDGIRIDRDVAVKLRDGITIYTDIYRPDGAENLPAIIAWSPYGKRMGYAAPMTVQGVPMGTLSQGAKLEGPDPDYWCRQGYAVINPDARGIGHSEGVSQFWTHQEGQDIHDLVEWLAVQDWSNGKVGMAGNSWLACSQWHAAAQRPPHLACIAPWESTNDPYRQIFMQGGIPDAGFAPLFDMIRVGTGFVESFVENYKLHPMRDAYWQEKVPDLEQIEIPVYATAGWSHFHIWGSIHGFNTIKSTKKWLRIHREFEWADQYSPENLEDLKRFFDRYLKGHHNGWELTPLVRMDVMDRGDRDHEVRRKEISFPLPDTQYRKLFLDAANTSLGVSQIDATAQASYDGQSGNLIFDHVFERDTELSGYAKLRLWVEAKGADDMDLFISLRKADADGNVIPTLVVAQPHPGAYGRLRVSQRELDQDRSTEAQPLQLHLREQKLKPGEIVPVDIAISPSSRFWHAGERLQIVVAGHYERAKGWPEPLAWHVENKGQHVIHTGGQYDSHLLVPEIPALRPVVTGQSVTSIDVYTTLF